MKTRHKLFLLFGLALNTTNFAIATTLFEALPPNLGEIQVTPSQISTKQSTLVTVTLPLQYEYKPDTVILQRVTNNSTHSNLADFHDDGKNGDSIAGDGVYTAQITLTASSNKTKIRLEAVATFKTAIEQQTVNSLWADVEAKTDAGLAQGWASKEGEQVVFRDKQGNVIPQRFKRHALSSYISKQQAVITSPDKSHVGIFNTLELPNQVVSTTHDDESNSNIKGWEFQYKDIDGVVWTKETKEGREFYLVDSNSLISENGERVLLAEVTDGDDEPTFTVYDKAGKALLQEKLAFTSLEDAQISENGRYLYFKGMPSVPKLDYVDIVVIDIDNPTQRWKKTYRSTPITAEKVINNSQGGFDVWLNNKKSFSFPE